VNRKPSLVGTGFAGGNYLCIPLSGFSWPDLVKYPTIPENLQKEPNMKTEAFDWRSARQLSIFQLILAASQRKPVGG